MQYNGWSRVDENAYDFYIQELIEEKENEKKYYEWLEYIEKHNENFS